MGINEIGSWLFSLSSSVVKFYEMYQNYLMCSNFRDVAEIDYDLPINLILDYVLFFCFCLCVLKLIIKIYIIRVVSAHILWNMSTKWRKGYTFYCTDTSVSVQYKDFFRQNEVVQYRWSKTTSVQVTVYVICT